MKLTEQQRQELGNALGAALGLGRDTEVNPQWSALTKLVPHVEKLLDDTCEALAQKIEAEADKPVNAGRSAEDRNAYARMSAYDNAARIARGGTP